MATANDLGNNNSRCMITSTDIISVVIIYYMSVVTSALRRGTGETPDLVPPWNSCSPSKCNVI